MKTNLMRCFAIALGMSVCTVAQAQYGQAPYGQSPQAPAPQGQAYGSAFLTATAAAPRQGTVAPSPQSRWNNFNPRPATTASRQPATVFRQVSDQGDELLPPQPSLDNSIEEIPPGIPQYNPHAQSTPLRTQAVPNKGSYEPAPQRPLAPAYQSPPAYQPTPAQPQAPAKQSAPSHAPAPSYAPAPTYAPVPNYAPSPTYAPQADPYASAPSANYSHPQINSGSASCGPDGGIGYGQSVGPVYGEHADSGYNAPGCTTPGHHVHGDNPYGSRYASPYQAAVNSPWDGGCGTSAPMSAFGHSLATERPALFPWFGGANALFFRVANESDKVLAMSTVTGRPAMTSSVVDPGSATGYEIMGGRYLKCGTYGLGIGYFNFNPDSEMYTINGGGGDFRASMQAYHDYHLDLDGDATPNQVYQYITGVDGAGNPVAAPSAALNVRATRDLDVQGLELNLFSFGLLGYGRTTPACDPCGNNGGCGLNPFGRGFGRLGGPLTRPAANRVQIVTSHGARWFQIRDDAQLAYNIDGTAGYQATDIYDDANIENNLYGYQFGGLLNYCWTDHLSLNIGGKFGLYANDVQADRRVGTETAVAYRFGNNADIAQTSYSDVVLATLGEVNVGLGYRVSNAWTINGGYRVMGVSGIATAFDQMAQDFGTSLYPGGVHASDSLVLHGAYVGANFNW